MIPYTAATTANVPASGYSTDGSMSAASLFGGAGGDGGASGGDGGDGGGGLGAEASNGGGNGGGDGGGVVVSRREIRRAPGERARQAVRHVETEHDAPLRLRALLRSTTQLGGSGSGARGKKREVRRRRHGVGEGRGDQPEPVGVGVGGRRRLFSFPVRPGPGRRRRRGLDPLHDVQQTLHLRVVQRVVARGAGDGLRVRGGHRLGVLDANAAPARDGPRLPVATHDHLPAAPAAVVPGRRVGLTAARAPVRQARALDGPPVAAEGPQGGAGSVAAPTPAAAPPGARGLAENRGGAPAQPAAELLGAGAVPVVREVRGDAPPQRVRRAAHFTLVALELGSKLVVETAGRVATSLSSGAAFCLFFARISGPLGEQPPSHPPPPRYLRPGPDGRGGRVVAKPTFARGETQKRGVLLLRRRGAQRLGRQPRDARAVQQREHVPRARPVAEGELAARFE
mmetsp:Transcript_11699/g.50061  ORF Transcript_11699/g.50061 Transcript_11699/m.50061 type:complete len:455 (-) Transcript_11699:1313-2677(-)